MNKLIQWQYIFILQFYYLLLPYFNLKMYNEIIHIFINVFYILNIGFKTDIYL